MLRRCTGLPENVNKLTAKQQRGSIKNKPTTKPVVGNNTVATPATYNIIRDSELESMNKMI